jgi:hypothetical protein
MDTLDKKMQTILEREDLSADERLKQYDQSLYIYLNVYDDYRPRPVAIAPEPVKQDLSFARSRCSFGLSDVSPAVLVTNQILWNICLSYGGFTQ